MKSFKNSFLILLVLTVGLLDVKITKTEDEYTETELTPPPARIPERQPDRLRDFMPRFSKENNGPLLEYNSKDKSISRGSSHYNASNESDDDMFTPIKPSDSNQLNQPSKGFIDQLINRFKRPTAEPVREVPDRLRAQSTFLKPDNLHDWDIRTDEEKNLEASQRKALLDAENKRIVALEDKVKAMTTPAEIKTLTPQDVQDLSTGIHTLPTELIKALTPEQIQNMTIDQILIFNKEQIQNFNFKDLTIQQIKQLVQLRSTGLLQNLTDSQLSSLSSEQMEACLDSRTRTFTDKQLDNLRSLLRLRGGSAAKIWLKDLNMKNFKNIFKSDKTILKEFIQNSFNLSRPEDKLDSKTVQNAIAKLSRTERMDLFNDITHEELDKGRTPELRDTLFTRYEALFRKILPKHEMLVTTTDANNSIASTRFKIINMRQVDPNLSLAKNAKIIEKAQDLNYNLENLEKNMRQYLENNPSPKHLKALLVDIDHRSNKSFTDLRNPELKEKIKQTVNNEIEKLLSKNSDFKEIFQKLTAQDLADITKASIQNALSSKSETFADASARAIFQTDAKIYQKFAKPNTLIIPAEDASRKNQDSFTFDIIDISSIKDELNKINMPNVNIEEYFAPRNQNLTDNSPEYNEMINNTGKLINLANKLKSEQDLKLNISEIAIELKNYIARDKAPSVSENEDVKNYTLTRDGKTLKSSINFKGAPYDESIAQATKILGKKAVQTIREKTLGETQGKKLTGQEKTKFKNALETVINQLIEANSKGN